MTSAVRRAGQHIGRLSLIALIVALVIGGIGGLDAAADRMLASGASRMLAEAEPAARTARVVASEARDAEAQDDAVRDAVARAFRGADIVVSRQRTTETDVSAITGTPITLRMLADDRVPGLATLTAGEWPQKPDQFALVDAAAQRAGLGIGDTVVVAGRSTARAGDVELELVGTWSADDPLDPAWHGDPAVVSGESEGAIGPAVVADSALAGLPGSTKVTWEIAPAAQGLAGIPTLQRALAQLRGLPDVVDAQRRHNTRVTGELGDTLQRQGSAVAATRGLLIAPLLLIAVLGALVLGIVLTTLSATRRDELVLLRSRGASRRRLGLSAAAESTVFALLGALPALAGLAVTAGITPAAGLTGAGAVAFAAVAAGILTLREATRADVVRPDAVRSDAGIRTLRRLLLPASIAVALASLSGWQLYATGSVVRADGSSEPLAAAAPALMLVAACTLAPVLAGPLAALFERLLRRSSGIASVLPLRQIARRMGSVAIAILCLTLAASSIALALAAPAAADAAEERMRLALLGADVRVVSEDGLSMTADTAVTWHGVTDAAEVLHTRLTVGSDRVALIAGPAGAVDAGGLPDADAGGRIVAGITRSLADRLGAEEGTVFTARVRSIARPVSIEVGRIVDALPGVGDGLGVATDRAQLRAAGADLPPNELWVRTDTPEATAAQLRAHATGAVRVLTAAQVSAGPVTSVAPILLTTGALVTALLGIIGFLAASSATARARRGERAILRALGLRPAQQRMLRAGETAGVAAYSVLVGAALGAAVASTVLPIVLGVAS